ncbi:MAG: WYL domain-containing protein [Myxococcales bacterium]
MSKLRSPASASERRPTPAGAERVDPRERLRRLLLLVPYAARKPGISVAELAKKLGVSRFELIEDLDLLAMVGRPPFSPDDFIDVYVEGETVHVALDQRFSRPPRLTPAEAAALLAAAQVMRPAARSALGSAQKKLLAALPAHARRAFGKLATRVGADEAPMDDLLEPLAKAAREAREVEFDYLTGGRGKRERRTVRPHAVYLHRGQWYLAGYCLMRNDDRLFRVDRMSKLAVTARVFTPGGEAHREDSGSQETSAGAKAVVRFTQGAAPFVRERFPEAKATADGGLEVELAGVSRDWIVPYVLGFGGEAQVVEPKELREAVLEAVQKIS